MKVSYDAISQFSPHAAPLRPPTDFLTGPPSFVSCFKKGSGLSGPGSVVWPFQDLGVPVLLGTEHTLLIKTLGPKYLRSSEIVSGDLSIMLISRWQTMAFSFLQAREVLLVL